MSFSRSGRLSRKRKNDDSLSQPESSQFDITVDDFQDDGPVFRLPPKRQKSEKVSNLRGRRKKAEDIEDTKNISPKGCSTEEEKNAEYISDGKKASERKERNDSDVTEKTEIILLESDNDTIFKKPSPRRSRSENVSNSLESSKNADINIELIKNDPQKDCSTGEGEYTEEIPDETKASALKEAKNIVTKKTKNISLDADDDSIFKKPSLVSKLRNKAKHASNKNSNIYPIDSDKDNEIKNNPINDDQIEIDKDLLDLEKSICTSYEKLCHCCKHIVPSSVYSDHLKECMAQKFKNNKRPTRSTGNTSESSESCNKDNNVTGNETKIRNEKVITNKVHQCPICSKVFKYPSQKAGHTKMCALNHGITVQEHNEACKDMLLQAEATENKGNTIHQNMDNKPKTSKRKQVSTSALKKDPDLAIALALSRSLAEDEVEKRSHEEEKLLALGLDDVVQEERKNRPIALLKSEPDKPQKGGKSSKRKKRGKRSETVLMYRSIADRERIISEKVAMLLSADDNPLPTWDPQKKGTTKKKLAVFQDQNCKLWENAQCNKDEPLDSFYVQDLLTHIKPQNIAVGGLFKRLSQIPGRLNATASLEESDSDEDYGELNAESSVADAYRTQLILAELMGSQEGLNFTVDEQDEEYDTSISKSSQSGFMFMQDKSKKGEDVADNGRIDVLPESAKSCELRNNNVKEVEIEAEVDDVKKSLFPANINKREINEIAQTNCSRNKTIQEKADSDDEPHSLQKQTETNTNEANKDSIPSLVEESQRRPIIIHDTEIIDVLDDDDDDDDDENPPIKLNNDLNINTPKIDSPKKGWIARNKEKTPINNSKSPSASRKNKSNLQSPKINDNLSGGKRKENITEMEFCYDTGSIHKQNKNDICDLNDTHLVLEEFEKGSIQKTNSPEQLLHCDTVLALNGEKILNQNKSNPGAQEVTPKRDIPLAKKPINKKLFSSFSQVSIKDNESKKIPLEFNKKKSESEHEIIDIDSCNSDNISIKKNNSNIINLKSSSDDTQTTLNDETVIFDKNENISENMTHEKSNSSWSSSVCKENEKNFDNKNDNTYYNIKEKMKTKIISDWGLLLESGEEADANIMTRKGEALKCHSLVFLARCTQLFKELKSKNINSHIKTVEWKEIPYDVAYKFLVYIYTGKCEIESKTDGMWFSLFNLAQRYKTYDLLEYLESLDEGIQIDKRISKEYTNEPLIDNLDEDQLHKLDSTIQSVNQSTNTDEKSVCPPYVQSFMKTKSPSITAKYFKDVTTIDGSQSPDLFDEDDVNEDLFDVCEKVEEYSKTEKESIGSALDKTVPFKAFNYKQNVEKPSQPFGKSFSHEQDEMAHEIITERNENTTSHNEISKNYTSMNFTTKKKKLSPEKAEEESYHQKLSSDDSEEIMELEQIHERASPLPELKESRNIITADDPQSEVENQMDDEIIDLTLNSEPQSPNSLSESPHKDQTSPVINSPKTFHDVVGTTNVDECYSPVSHTVSPDIMSNHSSPNPIKDVETVSSKLKNPHLSSVRKVHTLSDSFQTSGDVDFFDDDTEDMDPLILGEETSTSTSESGDPGMIENIPENTEKNMLKSPVHDEKNENMCGDDVVEGNMDHSYIDNVWDDFDDMGCDMALQYVPSPIKPQNVQEDKNNSAKYKEENIAFGRKLRNDNEDDVEESDILRLSDNEAIDDEESNSIEPIRNLHTNTSYTIVPNKEKASFISSEKDDHQVVSDVHENLSGKSNVSDNTLLRAADDADGCDWSTDISIPEQSRNLKFQASVNMHGNKSKRKNKEDHSETPDASKKKLKQITPKPDYKVMLTPELKKELSKYGIRPISKNKAVQLLTHVYEQTHPIVTDSEAETSYCETPPSKALPVREKKGEKKNDHDIRKKVLTKMQNSSTIPSQNPVQKKSSNKKQIPNKTSSFQSNLEEGDSEELLNSSQNSTSSEGSDTGCAEETLLLPGGNLEEEIQDDPLTSMQQGDLYSRVSAFIKQDPEMRRMMLLYEPIWTVELQKNLKANGIKCSMANLMDILDQQCVTFRTNQGGKKSGRRRQKKS